MKAFLTMKRTIRNSYYAYKLIDTRNSSVFYVGKGYGTRMYSHKTEALKPEAEWTNPHKCRKILKILESGFAIKYEYVLCDNEQKALDLERQWLDEYRTHNSGGILTNISEGGQTAKPNKIPIDVYTTTGQFVKTYESTAEAARELGVGDEGIIRRCLNHYDALQTWNGLVFVYHDQPFKYQNTKIKNVSATNGTETLTFEGTKKAAGHFQRSLSCIRQCCKNRWSVNGYVLSYIEQ